MTHGNVSQVISLKQDNETNLIRRRNVVGVGVGYKITESGPTDELAVIVNVERKLPKAQLTQSDLVPSRIASVRTDVIETGVIRAFQDHKSQWRPAVPAGTSMGHVNVTSGTYGCLVRRGSNVYALSNNHVLADVNQGKRGDPIIQPGQYDDGTLADQVAILQDYVPLDFGDDPPGCQFAETVAKALNVMAQIGGSKHRMVTVQETPGVNLVDAALAAPLDRSLIKPEILEIGNPVGSRDVTLGGRVKKSGRTTGYTEGRIIQVDVTTSVVYGGRTAKFSGQLMADGMSAPGDSGSAVLDMQNYVVGLLFAGSGSTTLINPIQTVLDMLNVQIVTG